MRAAFKIPPMKYLQTAPSSWSPGHHEKASAVLCLFLSAPQSEEGEAHILFTRRATTLRSHSGQISFPGGRREADDKSPVATALRETWEETCLDPQQVQILGSMLPLIGRDSRPIIPIVGRSPQSLSDLIPNPDEVDEIFSVPWTQVSSSAKENVRFNVFGKWRETPYFPADGYHIWGLTAWMLGSLGIGTD